MMITYIFEQKTLFQSKCQDVQEKIIAEVDTVLQGKPLDETSASKLT